jgi:choline-sulfatase
VKRKLNGGHAYSVFASEIYQLRQQRGISQHAAAYPRGLPLVRGDNYFVLEEAVDTLGAEVTQSPQPFLAYFHFIPPHDPYNTHREFVDRFRNDGFHPIEKPVDSHFAAGRRFTPQLLERLRRQYDEYILYADREFGRLFQGLEGAGLLANTWVVLTSDHGELFERGIWEHTTPVLYQPVVRVPLLIFEPGRATRLDVTTPTSAVDLLATLLQVTGGAPAEWCEGVVLPPYGGARTPEEGVYCIEAKLNDPATPLHKATVALIQGRYKLTRFFGYDDLGGSERVELYDVEDDPEELTELSASQPELARRMLNEMKDKLADMNRGYV